MSMSDGSQKDGGEFVDFGDVGSIRIQRVKRATAEGDTDYAKVAVNGTPVSVSFELTSSELAELETAINRVKKWIQD